MPSRFSQFLNELPFTFRRQSNAAENLVAPELAGITINVYELEIKETSEDGEEKTIADDSSPDELTPREETPDVPVASEESLTPKNSLLNQLRYANILVFCKKCKTEVPVCILQYHRRRYQALQMLRYSIDNPPVTLRGLLRRRNKAVEELQSKSFGEEGQLIRSIQKINVAFELLKNEIEGMSSVDQVAHVGNWREKDIKAFDRGLNQQIALGLSRSQKPDSGPSSIKCVYVDNFLETGKGAFLGIYRGYNGNGVTELCMRDLHKEIQSNLCSIWETGPSVEHIKRLLIEAYQKIDSVQLLVGEELSWNRWSGCSAVTCLIIDDMMYVANEGNLEGLLVRENNTLRTVTSHHTLHNRKERERVRNNQGLVIRTDKCALVNGVLETTRGLGNQGDWRLKTSVINKPRVRVVRLKVEDKMLVLASEGLWKMFNYGEILFLINKFIRDAIAMKVAWERETPSVSPPIEIDLLGNVGSGKSDTELKTFIEGKSKPAIDYSVPQKVFWRDGNPEIRLRRATILEEEKVFDVIAARKTQNLMIQKNNFSKAEEHDEDLQKMANAIITGVHSVYAQREISRLISKRLLKSALIAGANINNVVMVLLLPGFTIDDEM